MSSFSSLNLGSRAIFAAQRGLDITGQNIANSATPGYSRQRVDQVAVGGPTVPAIWSKYDQAGGGVKVTGVSRMRDEFLEARARTAHQNLGELSESQKTYEAIERTIGEPSNTGLKQRMAEFWQSWSAAGNDLKSEAPRNVVVERGRAVATELNRIATTLEVQWNDTRSQLDANINDINKAAGDIATLNRAIRNNVINGLPANELADLRDLLVEKVTTLTGGTAERAADGVVNVKLGPGTNDYLVSGHESRTLVAVGSNDAVAHRTAAPVTPVGVEWAKDFDGTAMTGNALPAGAHSTLAAQLTTLNTTLPSYLDKLDTIAVTIATDVNTQQSGNWTVTGTQQVAGSPKLFTNGAGALPAGVRAAATLQFQGGPNDLAISTKNPTPAPPAVGALNGDNAKDMSALMSKADGADDKLRGLVVTLGVEAASVYRNQQAAANVAKTADDARDSVSGVSLNEEMTHLIQYQHSFAAAAKFITAVDATIESLLNMTR
ncbi:hypothetical protein KEM60_03281 [Austwickia sp. TVS 96-490-7B]|uniref:flagellar hook-associated protein FlgK n=1 Tax=Austwickia sp. TVS 96-490-7B TaxID=2830843 RepID=UPI001C56731F|nr:flagellar hook-associated protein FlgK [Austwickia sp. TVS 96-490-7B]MBW3087051.1 hypothetical protein [Austwickia sp. TVS 96-490-7B]